MIKHFCDCCTKEIPKDGRRFYIIQKDQFGEPVKDMKLEYELCFDCKDRLKGFLEGSESSPCDLCSDIDHFLGIVCYIPKDNGDAEFVPMNFCPKCGRKVDE